MALLLIMTGDLIYNTDCSRNTTVCETINYSKDYSWKLIGVFQVIQTLTTSLLTDLSSLYFMTYSRASQLGSCRV